MERKRHLLVVGASVLLSTACGLESAVQVAPDRPSYAPGACVGLIVSNDNALGTVHVDHCDPPLERRSASDQWEPHTYEGDGCLLWGMGVSGQKRAGFGAMLPDSLEAGTYRFVVGMDWGNPNDAFVVASEPFVVEGEAIEDACMTGSFDPDDPDRKQRPSPTVRL